MKMRFEFFVASRYFKAKRTQAIVSLTSFLSIMGVALGVMALIVVLSVMKGFERDLSSRILKFQPHILIQSPNGAMVLDGKLLSQIKMTKAVISATPFVETHTILKTSSGLTGILVKGITREEARVLARQLENSGFQKLFQEKDSSSVLLGEGVIKRIGAIGLKEPVYLISPRGAFAPTGFVPGIKEFKQVGFFSTGFFTKDMVTAYVTLSQAQKLARMGSAITGIAVQTKDPMDAVTVRKRLASQLGDTYQIKDWGQMNQSLLSALKLEQAVTFLILALVIFVAALSILGTLIISVFEKTKDIAILKVIGVTNRQIKRIFVYNGLLVGGVGIFLGTGMGILISLLLKTYNFIQLPESLVYIGDMLPIHLDMTSVLIVMFCAMCICFFATVYPAERASRLNPVEILKNG